MTAVFSLSFLLVAPVWALMLFTPSWRPAQRLIASPAIAMPAAMAYAVAVVPVFDDVLGAVAPPDLNALSALLATPAGAMVAWVHFLAFDLFVARWIFLDSRERGVSHALLVPILLITLVLGPLGYLIYLGVRFTARRGVPLPSHTGSHG